MGSNGGGVGECGKGTKEGRVEALVERGNGVGRNMVVVVASDCDGGHMSRLESEGR